MNIEEKWAKATMFNIDGN